MFFECSLSAICYVIFPVDGYMLKKYRLNCIIPDEIEKEIIILIDFWKKVYTQEV